MRTLVGIGFIISLILAVVAFLSGENQFATILGVVAGFLLMVFLFMSGKEKKF